MATPNWRVRALLKTPSRLDRMHDPNVFWETVAYGSELGLFTEHLIDFDASSWHAGNRNRDVFPKETLLKPHQG